eukprot:1800233-Pleurochrysis_carterae.AAC.2
MASAAGWHGAPSPGAARAGPATQAQIGVKQRYEGARLQHRATTDEKEEGSVRGVGASNKKEARGEEGQRLALWCLDDDGTQRSSRRQTACRQLTGAPSQRPA